MLDQLNHLLTVREASAIFGIASLASQIILVGLYFRASRRHPQTSFTLLMLGALCAVISISTAILSTNPDLPTDTATNLYRAYLFLGFISLFLSIPGIWMLVRSYGALASQLPAPAPRDPPSSGKWGPP